ncbi:MAG: Demethylmenaquinone methyltransferase [Candidatus Parcubacteria bacterium]|jgi:ubiquinone/menaquinone biosynthesis C-methylase UbiE
MKQLNNKGFDYRIVSYEKIHSVTESDFTALLGALEPKEGQRIFEGCAGYGAVTERIFNLTQNLSNPPELFILDESEAQLERARQQLAIPAENIIKGDIRFCPFEDNFFDTVVVKMGIHEISFGEQKKAVREIFRILKPGGKFVMWDLALDNETQPVFQDIMRKKNDLAGFEIINQNRYLQSLDELHELYEVAGFERIEEVYSINHPVGTIDRLEELVSKDRKLISEEREVDPIDEIYLNMIAQMRLKLLNAYIRKRVPGHLKVRFQYQDFGNNINLTIPKMIMSGYKPK